MKAAGVLFFAASIGLALYTPWFDAAYAEEIDAQLKPVTITGYCANGVTKSGEETRPGICAYRPQDIGKTAVVYSEDMELIGTYEIMDTGKKSIRDGYVLDIWFPTAEECFAITQTGYVQVIAADG